jgi:hypothetical protein
MAAAPSLTAITVGRSLARNEPRPGRGSLDVARRSALDDPRRGAVDNGDKRDAEHATRIAEKAQDELGE